MVSGMGASVTYWLLPRSKQEEDNDAGELPKGQTGADPGNGGHRPKERLLLQVPLGYIF